MNKLTIGQTVSSRILITHPIIVEDGVTCWKTRVQVHEQTNDWSNCQLTNPDNSSGLALWRVGWRVVSHVRR